MDSSVRERIFRGLNSGKPHVKNEVLIQYSNEATTEDNNRVLDRIRGRKLETVAGPSSSTSLQTLKGNLDRILLPVGLSVADAIRSVELDPSVQFAEPNWIYQHQASSNDPYFTNGSLWGMYGNSLTPSNANGSQASVAWASLSNKTNCSNVYVGIIDEGMMFAHEDLLSNAGKNPGEVAGNGKDDDGNGFVDDVYGWDFDGNNNTVFDGGADNHGTHVAGTIGAMGGNAKGVVGVCWSIKLLNAKFLGHMGGSLANAIKSVDYFTALKNKGLNIVATNNSWGGGGYSKGLADAIERANAADILFIAAAGNDSVNTDISPFYPAGYTNDNIISVAAINSNGDLSSFSNYGASSADLGAPGEGIISTIPQCFGKSCKSSGYANYSGTSMATPYVTGAAALYKTLNPVATAAQIKAAILSKTTPTPSLSGKTVTGGRLNVGGF